VYGKNVFDAGPELRMTLDEPDDYEAYSKVYEALNYEKIVDSPAAAHYLQETGLDSLNEDVSQKTEY
jgi:spore coat polysaccharide biosynthesis protein SpsF (cytidylyltransferase family)